MKRPPLLAGLALLACGWAAAPWGMTGHMAAHMTAVALAAPFLAAGLSQTRLDPALRWPRLVTPWAMSVLELAVVWSWHIPAVRTAVAHAPSLQAIEQLCFLAVGVLLWSAVLAQPKQARASGLGVLLLTSMHMTLLGALIALAPRPLYGPSHVVPFGLTALQDQQLAGVVMLLAGGAAYLAGALFVLSGLLRQEVTA